MKRKRFARRICWHVSVRGQFIIVTKNERYNTIYILYMYYIYYICITYIIYIYYMYYIYIIYILYMYYTICFSFYIIKHNIGRGYIMME